MQDNELGPYDIQYTQEWNEYLNRWAIDDDYVIMPKDDFDKLLDYSCTNPTGVYANKVWKCQAYRNREDALAGVTTRFLKRYCPPVEGHCKIEFREIIVV